MKILAHRIKRELNLGESTQCAVYEDELKRLWPLNHKEREAKIAPSLRRNTDSVSGFTARDCAQSSTSSRDQSDVCNSFQPNYDTTATAPLLSWTIGIVLQGSKRFTQLCPPERIESWLWATGYQGCGVAIRRRRVVVCGGGMLFRERPRPTPLCRPPSKAAAPL